ncbi:RNA methyltransferase [Aliiglaciecola litoralis]|uniref:RNA methyltransferase n=1 Tax=Aliiglaciecola litoralis TaxID=582857 RepID=A0ABN1LCP7_9ALTE
MSIPIKSLSPAQCYIGLINPKSPTNVGAVLRAAGCYGASRINYTGQRYDNARRFSTDTKHASQHIPLQRVEDVFDNIDDSVRKVAIELVEGAVPLPHYQHHDATMYVFGPEDGTIPQSVLDRCDDILYVPTKGCMNLAATVNVLLYDRMAKSTDTQYCDSVIRASRDTNNRTAVAKTKRSD